MEKHINNNYPKYMKNVLSMYEGYAAGQGFFLFRTLMSKRKDYGAVAENLEKTHEDVEIDSVLFSSNNMMNKTEKRKTVFISYCWEQDIDPTHKESPSSLRYSKACHITS